MLRTPKNRERNLSWQNYKKVVGKIISSTSLAKQKELLTLHVWEHKQIRETCCLQESFYEERRQKKLNLKFTNLQKLLIKFSVFMTLNTRRLTHTHLCHYCWHTFITSFCYFLCGWHLFFMSLTMTKLYNNENEKWKITSVCEKIAHILIKICQLNTIKLSVICHHIATTDYPTRTHTHTHTWKHNAAYLCHR